MVALAIAACGAIAWFGFRTYSESQRAKAYDESSQIVYDVFTRWSDARTIAESTSRIALPSQVTALRGIQRETERVKVPDACWQDYLDAFAQAQANQVDMFLAFMGNDPTDSAMARATDALQSANGIFARCIREKPARAKGWPKKS